MAEPSTNFKGLVVPNTGDLVGTWGSAALNPDLAAIDGMFGGFATISLTNANVTLSVPAGYTATPGAGPTQSQNALIRLTGALTGNCVITFPLPGYYIVENLCTNVASFYVQLTGGSGNVIGAPPGKKCHVFWDGTNMDYVNMPDPGTAYDLHGASTYPPWMLACSVIPYLIKNGQVFNISMFPTLGAMLGSKFGGNGTTTFGVPDERARARIAFDPNGTGRLTAGGSGVDGTTMGSAGGNQFMQLHNHIFDGTQATWSTNQTNVAVGQAASAATQPGGPSTVNSFGTLTVTITPAGTLENTGAGASQNVQPSIVSFLPLIKT